MTVSSRRWIIPGYLALCLLLGGASSAGLWANALLQLLAVPVLCWAMLPLESAVLGRPGRQLLAIVSFALLLAMFQLIPLPPAVWAALPGREHVVRGFELLGEPLPWLPLSLAPQNTLGALLWMLPALAILLGLLRKGIDDPGRTAGVIIGIMTISVLIGALQISGGRNSAWYLYRITNYGVTVGFFANANHMATLLVVSVPFLAAFYATAQLRGGNARKAAPLYVLLVSALAMVVVGLVINGSLAGLGLVLPVAIASAMMLRRRKLPRWAIPVVVLTTTLSVATVMSGWFDNNLISDAAYSSTVSRYTSIGLTVKAALDYFPFGSGVGSFASIYRLYEAADQVTTTYINHAHSDYAELLLETGVFGLVLIVLFVVWWGRQTVTVWRSSEPNPFARAATIASAAILAHSLVDYPLRTAAISSIFALCCALMAGPNMRSARAGRARGQRPARHLTAS